MGVITMEQDYNMFKHGSTVEFIKRLKAAKFTEEQVEILATRDEERDKQLEHIFEFTAYQNMERKKLVTNERLDIVKLELQKEIEKTRSQIIIWVSGLLGTFGIFFLGVLAKGFHWI